MIVKHRFSLDEDFKKRLYSLKPEFGFDGFGEVSCFKMNWLPQFNMKRIFTAKIRLCLNFL